MGIDNVTIRLERPEGRFRPGEQIGGTVRATVEKAIQDGAELSVVFCWHGKGTPGEQILHRQRIASGPFTAGQQLTLPFSIPAPNWPPTYRGTVLSLGWFLRLRIGKESFQVPLVNEGPAGATTVRSFNNGSPDKVTGGKPPIRTFLIAASIFLLALSGLICGLIADIEVLAALSGIVGVFSLLPAAGSLWGIFSLRALGRVQVRIEPTADARALDLAVWMKPGAVIGGVTAQLAVYEVAVRSGGDHSTTYDHQLYHQRVFATPSDTPGEYLARLIMPEPGRCPWSLHSANVSITWAVRVDIDVPDLPDEAIYRPLMVWPAGFDPRMQPKMLSVPTAFMRLGS
ncbi:MAG: hypothetical protein AAGF12_39775 [Myxococcota bacterium]